MSENEFANWHWRNTMKPARFFMMDARATFPYLILLVHARTWSLALAICATALFYILERKGMTVPVAMRAFRVWLIGNYRPANFWFRKRKLLDTGSR